MGWQLVQLYESVGVRDLVEIVILAVAIYALLRLLGRTRGSGLVRGLGLVVVVAFLAAQVIIAAFDLMELGRVLDSLLTVMLVGLVVLFQPELRRMLAEIGNLPLFVTAHEQRENIEVIIQTVERLADVRIGALIAIEQSIHLQFYHNQLIGKLIRNSR